MLMDIRFLGPEDAGEWLRLRIEALQRSPEAFSASLEEYRSLNLEDVKKRLWSDGNAFVVGAFQDGRLIGVAGFYREKGSKSCHKDVFGRVRYSRIARRRDREEHHAHSPRTRHRYRRSGASITFSCIDPDVRHSALPLPRFRILWN